MWGVCDCRGVCGGGVYVEGVCVYGCMYECMSDLINDLKVNLR